jgi:hypothetical protein
MFTDEDVEVVSERMRSWSEALRELSEPELCRSLLTALDRGDGEGFHGVIGHWGFLEGATCVEIAETITRFVHTGDYQFTEVCAFANVLRPLNPSQTTGRGYRLPDGRIIWLSEADWWQMVDQAVKDEAWRKANHDLLVAVGILICHIELTPTVQRFDVTKTYQICPPTWDPHEGPR